MHDAKAIDQVKGGGTAGRPAQAGLHEVCAHLSPLRRNVYGRADVHAYDVRPGPTSEVEPAAHPAPSVQHAKALPGHLLGSLEVPAEDTLVAGHQVGEPAPFITEGAQGASGGRGVLTDVDRAQVGSAVERGGVGPNE